MSDLKCNNNNNNGNNCFYCQILTSVSGPQPNATLTHFATIRTDRLLAHVIPDTREMEGHAKVNYAAFRFFQRDIDKKLRTKIGGIFNVNVKR